MGNDQRADGVVAGPATGITDDVGITLGKARKAGRVESRIHAGQDGEATGWGQGQGAFIAELLGVDTVGRQDFVQDTRHGLILGQWGPEA
jgi:hypothetical protein